MSVPKWQSPELATAASPRSVCTELFQSHNPLAPLLSAGSKRSLSGTSAARRFPVHQCKTNKQLVQYPQIKLFKLKGLLSC